MDKLRGLPHGHPLQARAFLASARALAATSREVSVVLVDHVARHSREADPLLRPDLEERTASLAAL